MRQCRRRERATTMAVRLTTFMFMGVSLKLVLFLLIVH